MIEINIYISPIPKDPYLTKLYLYLYLLSVHLFLSATI